jgi:hypothetical protein
MSKLKKKPPKNKKGKILFIILLYMILCGVSIDIFIDKSYSYVWEKVSKLEEEAQQSLKDFFKNQNTYTVGGFFGDGNSHKYRAFIDTYYSNTKPEYTESKPPDDYCYRKILNDMYYSNRGVKYTETERPKNRYRRMLDGKQFDIYKFFKIDLSKHGWELFVAQEGQESFITYTLYPAYVAYEKPKNLYMYDWMPPVEICVGEMYDTWVNNSKQGIVDCYKKGSKRMVDDFIRDFGNEYYQLESGSAHVSFSSIDVMSNGYYYRVIAYAKDCRKYKIAAKQDKIDREIEDLQTKGIIIISCFFLVISVIHVCLMRKGNNNLKIKKI